MVRVTAMLIWWDEPVERLRGWVDSLRGVADRAVAIDGAYAGFPDGRAASRAEQTAALVGRAARHGIDLTVRRPAETWVGEVAKRQAMIDLAQAVSDDDDWLLWLDADERVTRWDPRVPELMAGHEPAGEIAFYGVPGPGWSGNTWEREGGVSMTRRLFRSLPDFRVERFHWIWTATWDGLPHSLTTGLPSMPQVPALSLGDLVRIEHLTRHTAPERLALKRRFYDERDAVCDPRGWEP